MHKQSRRNSPESVRELRMLHHKTKQTSKINDLRRRIGKVQIAIKLPIEEYLRNKGVSPFGTHHHSTFLALNGDFIGGGQKHKSHTDQLKPYLPKQKHYPYNPQGFIQKMNDEEEQLSDFMKKTGYVRVLNSSYLSTIRGKNDPHKLTFDINSKLTPSQLKSISETEKAGNIVTGNINRGGYLNGFREIAAEHAKVFNPQNLGKLKQRLAILPSKNEDVINAFKNKKPLKGRAYSTDGKSFYLFNHEIARHHKKGIEVSNAGFPTSKTYDTLRALGINTRIQKGVTTINGKQIDPNSGEFHLVPHKDIQSSRVYFSTPEQREKQKIRNKESGGMVNQRKFREEGRRRTTGNTKAIPMSPTQIQPHDQKLINSITGVKSPLGKPVLAPESHHILFKKQYPGLALNPNNSIPQERGEHDLLHKLNRMSQLRLKLALITPLILKKKKPRVIRKISVNTAMLTNSADDTMDKFELFLKKNPDIKGVSGVFDPKTMTILDANIPEHNDRLHDIFGRDNLVGFNSETDTRQGPATDKNLIRKQLKYIEETKGEHALGFDNGSLEALRIAYGKNDEEILNQLLEHQNSTGILEPTGKFRIVKNPKYK